MTNSRSYQPAIICDVVNPTSNPGLSALASVPTRVLPNGVQAYVTANRTLYRLIKAITTAVDGAQIAGMGGGTWVAESSIDSSASSISAENTSAKAITLTGVGNFLVMPSATGTFAEFYSGLNWELDADSGQLTYVGTGQPFLFSVTATLYNGSTVIDTIMSLNKSGTVINQRVEQTSPVATGSSSFYSMSLSSIVNMAKDDTLNVVFAGDSSTLTVAQCIYTLVPLA